MAASWSLKQLSPGLTDGAELKWLSRSSWESTAPPELVTAAKSDNSDEFGAIWRRDLRERRELAPAAMKGLLTAWSATGRGPSMVLDLVASLGSDSAVRRGGRPTIKPRVSWATRVQPLITALISADRPAATDVVEVLVALELLWTTGDRLPQRTWFLLWRRTLSDIASVRAQPSSPDAPPHERLLLEGELPVLAGLVYRHLAGSAVWLRKGQRFLKRALTAQTDTDGTPHGELLPQLYAWLAPLIRVTTWCQQAGQSLWDQDERELLSDVVEKAVAICRPNGRLALTNGHAADALPVLRHAADLFDWSNSNPSRACLQSLSAAGGKSKSQGGDAISIMPSNQSDWARFALLRTDWTAAAASVAIAHHQPLPQLDVTIGGESLIHGHWGLDVRLGDAGIELADEWNCVCWESQPEADYAELQMQGPGRLRVERLILLSRVDQFLMLADSISGAPPGPLALRSRLPLSPGVNVSWEPGMRSARLDRGRLKVRMLPLSLPADTLHSTAHRCEREGSDLVLEQRARGQGLFAPLIFDFHPQRQRREAAWAKLTVTEDGSVVTSDIAAAFRWKVGKDQWLVYRSLRKPKVPRAALGHHTTHGFTIGRFGSDGNFDPLLMVEE